MPDRGFWFQKRRQLFICTHHETLSVAAMRVCNIAAPTTHATLGGRSGSEVTNVLLLRWFCSATLATLAVSNG
jgi:hypothetical protein